MKLYTLTFHAHEALAFIMFAFVIIAITYLIGVSNGQK